jgi:glucokinase
MRLIAGDVGGTKTLLRCVESSGETCFEGRYDSTAYESFEQLVGEFTARLPGPADAACFAVAGPVFGGRATVTNIGWELEERALAGRLPIGHVSLINDFYAVALGVPHLAPEDLQSLHQAPRVPNAPIAILGAGTGLGQALVTSHGGSHHVIPSEGGHADFAPQDEEQTRLFLELHAQYGHVSWERLLSGSGLETIHRFLGGDDRDPAEIADRARDGDARSLRTFEIFVDIYGAEAGNMALRVLARGGVFLAGGIAAKNVERFTDGRFVEAYLRKGRFRHVVESIPVDIIMNEEVGLLGALEGARRVQSGPQGLG